MDFSVRADDVVVASTPISIPGTFAASIFLFVLPVEIDEEWYQMPGR